MKKGFFFSIDTALAIVITTIIIFGIFFNLSKSQQDLSGGLYLSKLANDALITLDRNKTLDTLNETIIKNGLNDILPNNLAFKLNITVYECTNPVSTGCGEFSLTTGKNIYIIVPNVTEKDSVPSKRMFLTFENNRIKYYSISELRVWLI